MALQIGSTLGPYEILGQIGAGGMGEVYKARDPRLGREVAIKVLPASLSQDPDRLRRFEQEAKAAGVLNHPNITAVYDIGSADGAPYVVQELLEGETLRSLLAGGRLPQRKAIDYALQMAHGLSAAHDKGIVHRDLKPENLFVTKDGRVKILDFGLAKLTHQEVGSQVTNLPTETRGTEPGVVMGTLGYMSPEQIKGKPADARSDIFALGAILYEMLSGRRAFHGESAGETMAAILKEEPADLSITNQAISPGLERIVRHCLEKNPEQRFHSAHDLAFDIEALSGTSATAAAPAKTRSLRLSPNAIGLAGLLTGFALAFLLLRGGSGHARQIAAMPTYRRLTNLSGAEEFPTLSPDGQLLAFVHRSAGKANVYAQRAGSRKPTNLTADCDRESSAPAFSPDGSQIVYVSQCGDGGLFVMSATGENVRRLTSFGGDPAWSPDGKEIVFSTEPVTRPYGRQGTSELWAVDVSSGKTRAVLTGGLDGIQASVSPHGQRIAYWALPTGGSQRDIWTIPYGGLKKGEQPVAVTNDPAVDWNPVWAPDGKSLYFLSNRNGVMNLWRVPIDEATGKVLRPAEPFSLPAREVGGIAVAKDGVHIAFVDRRTTHAIDRLTFDAEGRLTGKPEPVYEGSQEIADFDVSPDAKTLAFDSRGGAQDDLFLLSSDGTGFRQLLDDAPKDRHPRFTSDGKRLVFISDRSGRYEVWSIATDGSGLTQITKTTDETLIEPLISPDGRRVAVHDSKRGLIVPLDEKGLAGTAEEIRSPAEGFMFLPIAWSVDGRVLVGSRMTAKDRTTTALLAYDISSKKLSELVPGLKTLGRALRGSFLGNRLAYRDADGIHIADPSARVDRLDVPNPPSGSYSTVACRTSVCYAVRADNSADIWMRTEAEAKK
ncbi:MAG TPA: protein kinase [Thermoanaerobaculia bacterium]|nr:protein kinase [Thermoanaerobaculia bacterium]